MCEQDRSRHGSLVHEASSSGRWVEVVVYLEGDQMPVTAKFVCRTAEQAAEVARVLREAMTTAIPAALPPEPTVPTGTVRSDAEIDNEAERWSAEGPDDEGCK